MSRLFHFLLVALLFIGASCAPSSDPVEHFHGFQVFRVKAETPEQLSLLKRLDESGQYDFWTGPFKVAGMASDVMVSPERKDTFLSTLKKAGVPFSLMIEDVEDLILEQQPPVPRQSDNFTWTQYHSLDNIYGWLDNLAATNPNLVTLEHYGKSTEERDLKVLKISTGGEGKPAIWIDAGIHAREWISPALATYVINELVYNINNAELRNSLDFYFAPMINPDGYLYTHTTNRMWRKSRSQNSGSTCFGTDINRNFGFQWGIDDEGSSPNPCSETHRGGSKWSEPEAENMANYILGKANTTNWTAFITLHSYSQLWMSPYGYSATELPADLAELVALSDECVAALTAMYGTQYTTGAASQILYVSNGSSRDWAKGDGGFKWVYTIELRDTGRYGFILPPEQILPTVQETWAGIKVLATHVMRQSRQDPKTF